VFVSTGDAAFSMFLPDVQKGLERKECRISVEHLGTDLTFLQLGLTGQY
jgi:hypothetical protein